MEATSHRRLRRIAEFGVADQIRIDPPANLGR
jgi:hypothetical protein